MIREAIAALVAGRALNQDEAAGVMEEMMTGEATPAQVGAFLTALRLKGETADEIAGLAQVMRAKATRVTVNGPVIDTCGTGGDGSGSFNISTAAAFVAAGAGLKVAKHGNRAMSSQCGSADVLEALGVNIDLNAEQVAECIETVGMGFMFAQNFHPAMRYVAGPRRELGIRTVFNILGPLTNPAGATYQVLGVADGALMDRMASVLQRLGARHALVVYGQDGMDELSLGAPSTVYEVSNGHIEQYGIDAAELGLTAVPRDALRGASAQENAAALRGVLGRSKGPLRDVVVLNAAAVLVAGEKASDFPAGITMAQAVIDSGMALEKLDGLVRLSQRFAGGAAK